MKGRFYITDWNGHKEYLDRGDELVANGGYEIDDVDIRFRIDEFPSQCGVDILHDFGFLTAKDNRRLEAAGKAFAKDLPNMHFEAGAKLIASAVVGSPLYALLNNEYWWKGTNRRNSNSGNQIAIFELDLRAQ